jgi:8-oxo-dGTP pyrophosphatase MutT (NUDIX family)
MGDVAATTMLKIGAIIQDASGNLLVVKKNVPGRNTYIIPGGRPEGAETQMETLERELKEELGVEVTDATPFGTYEERSEFEDVPLVMTVFDVKIAGSPTPQSEIIDLCWIDRNYEDRGISIGSTLANHVVPKLIESGRM